MAVSRVVASSYVHRIVTASVCVRTPNPLFHVKESNCCPNKRSYSVLASSDSWLVSRKFDSQNRLGLDVKFTSLRRSMSSSVPETKLDNRDRINVGVADPAFVLNDIASRYQSTERILMEYIDNAIDDAEKSYRENNNTYPHSVKIDVRVDFIEKTVAIIDNCNGLSPEALENLVLAGNSKKRSVPWLNGRFGFGFQSFRAAASIMEISSRVRNDNSLTYKLTIDRSSSFVDPPLVHKQHGHGTQVRLSGFDQEWFSEITVAKLAEEIELHFEQLLHRRGLSIIIYSVMEDGSETKYKCVPFDYAQIEGFDIHEKKLLIEDDPESMVSVAIKVAPREYTGRKVRFYALGRRINEVCSITSYIRRSQYKQRLWAHPQVVGYIDVGTAVEYVYTRDELKNTKYRRKLYDYLLGLEQELMKNLEVELSGQREVAFSNMESVISRLCWNAMHKKVGSKDVVKDMANDYLMDGIRSLPRPEIETMQAESKSNEDADINTLPTPTPTPAHRALPMLVSFIKIPQEEDTPVKRSMMVDDHVYINTLHDNFQDRLQSTSTDSVKFSEALASYVSALVSHHLFDSMNASNQQQHVRIEIAGNNDLALRENIFNGYFDTWTQMDTCLRNNVKIVQKSIRNSGNANANASVDSAVSSN